MCREAVRGNRWTENGLAWLGCVAAHDDGTGSGE